MLERSTVFRQVLVISAWIECILCECFWYLTTVHLNSKTGDFNDNLCIIARRSVVTVDETIFDL